MPSHCYRMRVFDRDLIRGGHYGQRSCEPHLKAEHMAAPTNAAYVKKSPCQLGAVHTGQKPTSARLFDHFIGSARMAVYNIAPYNGGFRAWVDISWGSPLNVRFDVLVDP